jgi:hypothetical protein
VVLLDRLNRREPGRDQPGSNRRAVGRRLGRRFNRSLVYAGCEALSQQRGTVACVRGMGAREVGHGRSMVCPDGTEKDRRLDTRALGGRDAVHVVLHADGPRAGRVSPVSAVYGRTLAGVLEDEGTVIRRIADAIS